MTNTLKCYFFGNSGPNATRGHAFYIRPWLHTSKPPENFPWSLGEIDGRLSIDPEYLAIYPDKPERARQADPQVQGQVITHYKDGWTAFAFWDRSGDERPGSNSCFFINRQISFQSALSIIKQHWGEHLNRLKSRFDLVCLSEQPKDKVVVLSETEQEALLAALDALDLAHSQILQNVRCKLA